MTKSRISRSSGAAFLILLGFMLLPGLGHAVVVEHTYDSLNRLVRTVHPGGKFILSYEYDSAGNMRNFTHLKDSDGDGLDDTEEISRGTDPEKWDSDGDGMPDGWEVKYEVYGLKPLIKDANDDLDKDGFSNLQEYLAGTDPKDKESKPAVKGMPWLALLLSEDTDTDGDGMPDDWEKAHGLNHTLNDAGEDPDADDLTNLQEYQQKTDPQMKDTDKDGMPDGWEVQYGLNPLVNDANEDLDKDGFNNLREYLAGTNPGDPNPPYPPAAMPWLPLLLGE